MEINDEFLLQCVSNYKPLYDKSDKAYKSIVQKENCWASVASSLRTTVAAVKARYKALREKYRREVQIEEKYRRSGAPANARPTWPLLSFFKFMYGQEEHRETVSNYIDPEKENISLECAGETENTTYDYGEQTEDIEVVSEHSTSTNLETPAIKKRKLSKQGTSSVDNALADVSQAIRNISERRSLKTKYHQFAQYMASELNEMDEDNAELLMEEINIQIIEFKRTIRGQN